MNDQPMTRLENMRQFLLEYGVDPTREPINTVMFHLGAAERELTEERKQKDQWEAENTANLELLERAALIGEKLAEQRDRLAEALRKVIDPRCSDREKFIHAGNALSTIYKP